MTTRAPGLIVGAAMLLLSACGGSLPSGTAIGAPNQLEAISLQAADVPAGLHACSQSGDITKILSEFKAADLSLWSQVKSTWTSLQNGGATAGWWQLFADSQHTCDGYFAGNAGLPQDATPSPVKMIVSTVTQFPDSQTALSFVYDAYGHYTGGGFGPYAMAPHKPWYPDGTKLGVGSNSVFWASKPGSGDPLYLNGGWLNKSFLLSLDARNIPLLDAERAVTAMNAHVP